MFLFFFLSLSFFSFLNPFILRSLSFFIFLFVIFKILMVHLVTVNARTRLELKDVVVRVLEPVIICGQISCRI